MTHDHPARVFTYCHDGYGLGHLRRTLALATELVRASPRVSILSATGSPAALQMARPRSVDLLKLPSLTKDSEGHYVPDVLELPLRQLIDLRASLLEAAVTAYRPELMLVDHYPLGVQKELQPALDRIQQDGATRLVLGLRDVLDEPVNVRNHWRASGHLAAIAAYDHVMVFGDPLVYDPVAEYDFDDETAEKLIFTGYLVSPERVPVTAPAEAGRRRAVCTLGGGKDAPATAWAFLRAVDEHLPAEWEGVLITGPLMAASEVAQLRAASAGGRVLVVDFVPDVADLMATADVTLCMGGYNTMCDVLSVARPTVVVPRVQPRSEQLIRARAFADRGVVRLLHPDQLTPATAASAMLRESARRHSDLRSAVTAGFAVNGLRAASQALTAMLPRRGPGLTLPQSAAS